MNLLLPYAFKMYLHKNPNSYLSKNVNYAHKYEGQHLNKERKKPKPNPRDSRKRVLQ